MISENRIFKLSVNQNTSLVMVVMLNSDQHCKLMLFKVPPNENKMNYELMLTYDTPAYMFNVYKNQLSRQTGSRNLMGPKTFPTIWHTYINLVTKYQISAINSCWEKCAEKYFGTDRGKSAYPLRWSEGINTPPPVEWGYNYGN